HRATAEKLEIRLRLRVIGEDDGLAPDQLDPVGRFEDPHLAHPVVLLARELSPRRLDLDCHDRLPIEQHITGLMVPSEAAHLRIAILPSGALLVEAMSADDADPSDGLPAAARTRVLAAFARGTGPRLPDPGTPDPAAPLSPP